MYYLVKKRKKQMTSPCNYFTISRKILISWHGISGRISSNTIIKWNNIIGYFEIKAEKEIQNNAFKKVF